MSNLFIDLIAAVMSNTGMQFSNNKIHNKNHQSASPISSQRKRRKANRQRAGVDKHYRF